jgi:hypothetical protein
MLNEFEVNESIEHWRDEEASEPLPYIPTKEWTADDRPKYAHATSCPVLRLGRSILGTRRVCPVGALIRTYRLRYLGFHQVRLLPPVIAVTDSANQIDCILRIPVVSSLMLHGDRASLQAVP